MKFLYQYDTLKFKVSTHAGKACENHVRLSSVSVLVAKDACAA